MVVEQKIRSTAGTSTRINDGIFQPNPQHKGRPETPQPKCHRKKTNSVEDDDDEEEEAEVAFAVLVEQGKEVAAEASRASSSI